MSEQMLLAELAEPVERLVHRHLDNAHEWYPYETTPWSVARNFTDADPWSPDEYPLPDGVRSALYVHLLTEDNLPYYTHTILNQSGPEHPLNEWTRRWTAEEGRHSMAIRDWMLATRAFDPRELEQGRMAQMAGGQVPHPASVADMLAYTAFQERATRVAHSNTGRKLGKERGGSQVMAKVAGDEDLHYKFYRDAATAAIEIDPSTMVVAILRQLRHFDMPGTGIPNFDRHKDAIAREGIFDGSQYVNGVVKPTLAHFEPAIQKAQDRLTPEAEKAYLGIHRWVRVLGRAAAAQAVQFAKLQDQSK